MTWAYSFLVVLDEWLSYRGVRKAIFQQQFITTLFWHMQRLNMFYFDFSFNFLFLSSVWLVYRMLIFVFLLLFALVTCSNYCFHLVFLLLFHIYLKLFLWKYPFLILLDIFFNFTFVNTFHYSQLPPFVVMMIINCFCDMDEQQKVFTLISSWDHCQRSSSSWISNTLYKEDLNLHRTCVPIWPLLYSNNSIWFSVLILVNNIHKPFTIFYINFFAYHFIHKVFTINFLPSLYPLSLRSHSVFNPNLSFVFFPFCLPVYW